MKDLGVETWIGHGTLLGWYWNQRVLPWDNDIDVQMTMETLSRLAARNMSEYHYPAGSADQDTPRTYLLEINPHYRTVSTRDVANKIDGRWIDTTNGKYIDITAVHVSAGKAEHTPFDQGVLFSKEGHRYLSQELFPLQNESFEGIAVRVPRKSAKILSEEYGEKSLTNTRFHWHRFNKTSKIWEPE